MSPTTFGTWESSTGTGPMQPIKKTVAVLALTTSSLAATPTTAGMPPFRTSTTVDVTTSGLLHTPDDSGTSYSETSSIQELRRLTGLTWDQVASVFGVTRRSVFLWARGKSMSAENEELLARLLGLVQWMDRGSVMANRDLLLAPAADGIIVLDLLREGRLDEARARLRAVRAERPNRLPALAASSRQEREPLGIQDLLGAIQEPIRTAPERVLPARRIRRPAGT